MNTHPAWNWALLSILSATTAACASVNADANPHVAFAVDAGEPVCRLAGAPVVLSAKSYLKPFVPDGVIAVVQDDRIEAVFTARGEYGRQCVAVDVRTLEPRPPGGRAEHEACRRLGHVDPIVSATSEAETMLAWDSLREDAAGVFVGVVTYDLPALLPGTAGPNLPAMGRPQARVASHLFSLPSGGLAGAASHPGLADISHERFLLSWTQGTVEQSQLRAQPVAGWGDPIGPALDVAPPDVSPIGSASAAFGAEGLGAVAYLAAAGDHVDVMANLVDCSAAAASGEAKVSP
jgi:hypothetical protein